MSKIDGVVAEIQRRLGRIRQAAGFNTDHGENVFDGAGEVPADQKNWLVIEEGDEEAQEQQAHRKCRVKLPLTIEGHIQCDPAQPNRAGRKLAADIQRGIFEEADPQFPIAAQLTYAGRRTLKREGGSDAVVVQVMIEVSYVTDLKAP